MAAKKTEHGTLFQKYYDRYRKGGCKKEQLKRIVAMENGALTRDDYFEITGEVYE